MPTYIALLDWTDQGVQNFNDTVDRYEAARERFKELGVTFKDVYWTLGGHDIVAVLEAEKGEMVAAATLAIAAQGNVRTKTLRALSADEMRGVIEMATG